MFQLRKATDTASNLIDSSSRDQDNQIQITHNSDTKAHARRGYFWKARDHCTADYEILPLIVLIMLCSVVNGDPPTALTSGLLNTAATGDTTIDSMAGTVSLHRLRQARCI